MVWGVDWYCWATLLQGSPPLSSWCRPWTPTLHAQHSHWMVLLLLHWVSFNPLPKKRQWQSETSSSIHARKDLHEVSSMGVVVLLHACILSHADSKSASMFGPPHMHCAHTCGPMHSSLKPLGGSSMKFLNHYLLSLQWNYHRASPRDAALLHTQLMLSSHIRLSHVRVLTLRARGPAVSTDVLQPEQSRRVQSRICFNWRGLAGTDGLLNASVLSSFEPSQ